MLVESEVEIHINKKVRNQKILVDLALSSNLQVFKEHLLSEVGLSAKQQSKYLLKIHTSRCIAITKGDLDSKNIEKQEYLENYEPIIEDSNLMH